MFLFVYLISLSVSQLLEYRLWKNYGQVLYDYTGNGNHGWNGKGTDSNIRDCLFTDRGAYLNTNCYLNFAKILYPNPVSVVFWALSDDTQSTGNQYNGRIFCRWSLQMSFMIFHDKPNLGATIFYQNNGLAKDIVSTNNIWKTRNFYLGEWALVSGEINQNTVKVKINGIDILVYTDTINYQESIPLDIHKIGNDNPNQTGLGGFVWYAAIYSQVNVESNYLSSASNNCFIGTCSTCDPSFIIPSLGTGCGPNSVSTTTDSYGNSCTSGYGCKGSLMIKCNCPSNSCELTSTDVCSCIEVSLGIKYQAACICAIGGQGCCQSECSSCDTQNYCESCKVNFLIMSNGECICQDGYVSNPLTSSTPCIKCNTECETCSTPNICTKCIDTLASLTDGKCFCPEGYFALVTPTTFTCTPCLYECKICEEASFCLTCKALNSVLISGRCVCISGYFGSYLNQVLENCIKCDETCSNCTKLGTCTECVSLNSSPINGICVCDDGFWASSSLSQLDSCQACEFPCKTCRSLDYCLSCSPSYSESVHGTCLCQDQYFKQISSNPKEFICTPCDKPCLTCLSLTQCLTCDDVIKDVDKGRCICKKGFYLDDQKCMPCNKTCATCESSLKCTSCFNGSFEVVPSGKCLMICPGNLIRIGDLCDCAPGKISKNNSCVDYYFHSSLKISKSNKLSLQFDHALKTSLDSSDISLKLENKKFQDFKLFKKSDTEILFLLTFHDSISKNSIISINLKKPLFSKKNAILKNYELSGVLFEFEYIDPEIKKIIKIFDGISKTAFTVSLGTSIISKPAAAWAILGTLQLLPYIPLSENYNETVTRTFFTSAGDFNLLPNLLVYVFSEDSSNRPSQEARSVGIESSVFWVNLGDVILPLLVLVILWPIISIFTRFKIEKITEKMLKILENYKYSVFSRFWIQAYLDIGVFSILNLKAGFNHSEPQFYINQFSAALGIVRNKQLGVALSPILLFIFLFSIYEKISKGEEITLMKYGTFFSEFKNNKGKISVFFYVFWFLRRLQFILTQFYLNEYKVVQMAFNMCGGFFMVAYLAYYRPFKDIYIQISNFITEVNFSVIFTAYVIFSNDRSLISEKSYQYIVIFTVITCIGIQAFISLIEFLISMKGFYFKLQELRNKLISEECKSEVVNIERIIRII